MSFASKSPSLPQGAVGNDPKFNASIKEARPVPMGWGRHPYAPNWISAKYDEHTQRAGENKPEWQYCSIAAKYCHGPIDFVGKVWGDGKIIVNLDYTFADGEEAHTFTINPSLASGRAWQAIVHRGTSDTPESAVTNLRAQTGQHHPPYRNFCWVEWLNIDLGAGNTSLPSLTIELGTHAPAVGDFAGGDSHPYGVNPFAVLYAFALHEAGGALDGSLLEASHWGDQSLALEATGISGRSGNLVHCHPNFDEASSFGDAISRALAYVDAFLFIRDGKLCIDWFPAQPVDASALPEISEADLTEKPSGALPDWTRGPTSVTVIFKSFDKDYEDEAARYNVPTNRENTYAAAAVRSDRPFIHASDQAALIASEIAAAGDDERSLSLTVLKSRAVDGDGAPLMPGALINFDYAPHALDFVCRIVARRIRPGVASDTLTIVRERGAFPRPYVAPVDERVLPTSDDAYDINIADVRLWFLPLSLADGVRAVTALIDRTKRTIYRFELSMSTAGSSPWEDILDGRFFVAKCAVSTSSISSGATTVRVSTSSVDFSRMPAQSAVAQADDTVLALIGDELVSVGTIASVSAGVYDLGILRGRQGTTAAGHSVAALVWLFIRSELQAAEHAEFYHVRDGSNVYDSSIATKHFKIALATLAAEGNAKPDDPGISLVLPDLAADETRGYTITISNEAHTVACDVAGTVNAGQLGSGGTAKSTVTVARGSTPLTVVASAPNSDQFSIALSTLTNTTATKEANDRIRCDTLTADTGTIAIDITVAGGFTITKTFTLTKAYKGTTGATGSTGGDGPGIVYRGAYSAAVAYFHTATRRDVVLSGGSYWLANNPAKSGLTTWGTPGTDWAAFGATFSSVATELLLAVDATILKTLVMGDGSTANAGIIRSAGATAYGTGTGFWMNPRNGSGDVEFRIGSTSKYARWTGSAFEIKGDYFEISSATAPLVVDIDSSFVGPNPPARLTFGGLLISASSGSVTTLSLTAGGATFPKRAATSDVGFVVMAGGTSFLGYGSWIKQTTGEAQFVAVYDGNGDRVLSSRKAALTTALTNANDAATTGDSPAATR